MGPHCLLRCLCHATLWPLGPVLHPPRDGIGGYYTGRSCSGDGLCSQQGMVHSSQLLFYQGDPDLCSFPWSNCSKCNCYKTLVPLCSLSVCTRWVTSDEWLHSPVVKGSGTGHKGQVGVKGSSWLCKDTAGTQLQLVRAASLLPVSLVHKWDQSSFLLAKLGSCCSAPSLSTVDHSWQKEVGLLHQDFSGVPNPGVAPGLHPIGLCALWPLHLCSQALECLVPTASQDTFEAW